MASLSETLRDWLHAPLQAQLGALMATAAQLQQQLTDAKTSLQAAIGRVQADVDNLKEQLAGRVDPAELDPISQGLADLKAATDALDPDPDNPAPTP